MRVPTRDFFRCTVEPAPIGSGVTNAANDLKSTYLNDIGSADGVFEVGDRYG
ncbi:hypothetical protein [Mycobacterium sp.]|uniref:hypothetical protein n=1 Tax=Mycobacterium sp. TaxID=1785 RepID=UPI0039C902AF